MEQNQNTIRESFPFTDNERNMEYPVDGYKYVVVSLLKNDNFDYLFSGVVGIFNTPKDAYIYLTTKFRGEGVALEELTNEEQSALPSVSYKGKYEWFIIDPIKETQIQM